MLKLKPNCECCDRDLPPDSRAARICTFECTFCTDCAQAVFDGVCPNCGGDLVARPVRPAAMLPSFPASQERYLRPQPCGGGRSPGGSPAPPPAPGLGRA